MRITLRLVTTDVTIKNYKLQCSETHTLFYCISHCEFDKCKENAFKMWKEKKRTTKKGIKKKVLNKNIPTIVIIKFSKKFRSCMWYLIIRKRKLRQDIKNILVNLMRKKKLSAERLVRVEARVSMMHRMVLKKQMKRERWNSRRKTRWQITLKRKKW